MHVDAGLQPGRILAGAARRLAVEIEERRKPAWLAPDDGQRYRQAERAGTRHRLRRAADGDPERQHLLQRPGIDAAIVDRRPHLARPADFLALAQRHQKIELLGKELVVVVERLAEEREAIR